MTQEAFIKAYRALPTFRGDSAFYTWLYRIGINTAKNYLVAAGRRAPTATDVNAEEAEGFEDAAELRDIARRGTRIHFIFADRDPGGQMLRDEGGYTVGRIARTGRLDVQTIVNADHTFTSWRNQQVLVNRIVELTTGGTVSR